MNHTKNTALLTGGVLARALSVFQFDAQYKGVESLDFNGCLDAPEMMPSGASIKTCDGNGVILTTCNRP